MRISDENMWDLSMNHICRSLRLLDKYLYTDKFEVICSVIDYLDRDQYGYIPFHPCEFE